MATCRPSSGSRPAQTCLVSDGSGRPYRVRVRPPCFYAMGALGDMLKGHMVADIITTFGQINMIGGECDR